MVRTARSRVTQLPQLKPPVGPRGFRKFLLLTAYFVATVQVLGCYFTLVHPYINTLLYESGRERLPFQTRLLMVPLMRWAHGSPVAAAAAGFLYPNRYWYLRPPEPEAIVQLLVNLASLLIAGYATQQIYRAASNAQGEHGGLLGAFVYPLFLLLFAVHYILHTIQNFRFIYDLPSLAFFAVGLWLIYTRRHPLLFAALFLVATLNRETTLLLLPFFVLSEAAKDGDFDFKRDWRKAFAPRILAVAVPLAAAWLGWHAFVFHLFRHNVSEYYPRISLNFYTFLHPRYWPQLFSAGGFLLPFVFLLRRSVADVQLRAWMWALPIWGGCMFFWGILVETRVFGELLPFLTCLVILVAEDRIGNAVQQRHSPALVPNASRHLEATPLAGAVGEEEAA